MEKFPEFAQPAVPETQSSTLSPETKEQAAFWLERIEKEKAEKRPEPTENERMAAELKELFEIWLAPERLEALNALTTVAEAMASPERKEGKTAVSEILNRIKAIQLSNPSEDVTDLMRKYQMVSNAVGFLTGGGRVKHG